MKSYFARLADRAIDMPAPAAAGAGKVADPFDVVAPPEPAQPSSDDAARMRSSVSALVAESEAAPMPVRKPAEPPTLATRSDTETPPREDTVQSGAAPLPPPIDESRAPTRPRVPAEPISTDNALSPPMSRADLLPPQPAAIGETNRAGTEPARLAPVEERRDESGRLRKADQFMQQVLDRPQARLPEADAVTADPPAAELRPPPDPVLRLQPMEAAPRTVEAPLEPPALVIGTITVEVVPPAPVLPAPRPQVVVIRGASAERPRVRSSRRFGLGQW